MVLVMPYTCNARNTVIPVFLHPKGRSLACKQSNLAQLKHQLACGNRQVHKLLLHVARTGGVLQQLLSCKA